MAKELVYCSVCGSEWTDATEVFCPCGGLLVVEPHEDTETTPFDRELATVNYDEEYDMLFEEYPEYDVRRA